MPTATAAISSYSIHRANRQFAAAIGFGPSADGMVVPVAPRLLGPSLVALAGIAAGYVAIKVVLIVAIGAQGYGDALFALSMGNGSDRIAGWIMQADPISRGLGDLLARLAF